MAAVAAGGFLTEPEDYALESAIDYPQRSLFRGDDSSELAPIIFAIFCDNQNC